MPFRTMFQYVNVASISPAMSFRVFDISLSRRWGSLSLFQNPILTQFGCSFFLLKATIYTFQVHVLMCKCGQYWPCHFSFDGSLSRTWGSVSLFQNPILTQFECSLLLLKANVYTFQDHVSMFQCGQYWSCNFISKF